MSPKIEESKNKRLRGSHLSTDAFLLFDENLNLVDINDAGQRLFDMSAEAALGKCIMDVMPNIKKSDIYNKYRHILKTGEPLVIHQNLGDRSVAVQVFKLGDSLGIIVSDITERKKTEEALQISETRYRRLFEAARDGILLVDAETGQITEANPFIIDLLGYSCEELLGKQLWEIGAFKDIQASMCAFGELQRKEYVHYENLPLETKDRRSREVEFVSNVYLVDSKRVIQCNIRDITERKRAEEERESLLAKLSEKNKELEQIIYVTSHDLRSPLVNIQGFAKELGQSCEKVHDILYSKAITPEVREKLISTLSEDIPSSLQYILASSAKMDSLLSGLLKLSRMGRDTLRIKRLDMSKLISKVISSFEFQIKEVDATVKVEELPPCYGDETQIDQVFSNLVGNALKFLDPKRPGVIRVSGKKEKEQAVYCVEDNGIGIAEKDKDVIFGIFSKLDPDDKRGEGLGLTIVRKILDRHGGEVWVESEPGKGSKFFVSLPDISR